MLVSEIFPRVFVFYFRKLFNWVVLGHMVGARAFALS